MHPSEEAGWLDVATYVIYSLLLSWDRPEALRGYVGTLTTVPAASLRMGLGWLGGKGVVS